MTGLGHVCVIGDGLAGNLFTRRLLAQEPHARITVLGADPAPAYNRVLLPDVLAGRTDRALLALPAPKGPRLRVRTGVRVARIERCARTLATGTGASEHYDTLVLATGANPVLPALPGLRDPGGPGGLRAGAHTLRTLADLDALRPAALAAHRAVVIGGGLLGVQCARALASMGPAVELLHQGPHLLDHRIDDVAGAILARTLRGHGVEVHTGCRARAVLAADGAAHGAGPARGVRLADGMTLECDLVLFACGAAPASALAEAAGLAVRPDTGGVLVDDWLRSVTDPSVYAIGDCAAPTAGAWPGLAAPALAQAEFLAARLAGRPTRTPRYRGAGSVIRLGGDGIDLAVLAAHGPRERPRTVRLVDPVAGTYRSVTVGGGRLLGSVLVGDVSAAAHLSHLLTGPGPLPADPLDLLIAPVKGNHP
jgi:assimilatory nitrate reductase electron transfer subunit